MIQYKYTPVRIHPSKELSSLNTVTRALIGACAGLVATAVTRSLLRRRRVRRNLAAERQIIFDKLVANTRNALAANARTKSAMGEAALRGVVLQGGPEASSLEWLADQLAGSNANQLGANNPPFAGPCTAGVQNPNADQYPPSDW